MWRGELSIRRACVLLAGLPEGSAVWCKQQDLPYGWTLTAVLLADNFHAIHGEPHPLHPKTGAQAKAKSQATTHERLKAQRERLSARKAAESE